MTKFRPTFVVILFLAIGGIAAGEPFPGSSLFMIKPNGHLFVMNGKLYCWYAKGSGFQWEPSIPEFSDAEDSPWYARIGGEAVRRADKSSNTFHLNLYGHRGKQNFKENLVIDENGTPIASNQQVNRTEWHVDKDPKGWPRSESRAGVDDNVYVFEIRADAQPKDANFLGISKESVIVKDLNDREHKFHPLILTDKINTAQLAFNDYSGK